MPISKETALLKLTLTSEALQQVASFSSGAEQKLLLLAASTIKESARVLAGVDDGKEKK